jgi:hypothetical protein
MTLHFVTDRAAVEEAIRLIKRGFGNDFKGVKFRQQKTHQP